ncbi:glycosyltransferase [Bacillus sp. UMB0899]|nr:glycosyltransferase [Bacillus sp. UMB0899]
MLKVLHIINSLDFGGAETLLKESLPLFKEKGIDCDVLVLRKSNSGYEEFLKGHNIDIFYSNIKNIYNPLQISFITNFLNKNEYDVVHSHPFPSQYWVSLAKTLTSNKKVKFVTTEHNTSNGRRGKKIFYFLDKLIYSQYKKIICISEGTKRELVKWVPDTFEKAYIIENGVNLNKFINSKPLNRTDLIPTYRDGDKLILMTARLTEQKDHQTVINAASELPNNIHFLFAGDGEKRKEYETIVEEKNLTHRIHFLGMRPDVERIIKTVDLFVLSSHYEGFGLVAVEAMASGIPVIASNVSGLAEVVNEAGILFDKGNHKALISAINELVIDNNSYAEAKHKGIDRSKKYSLSVFVDNHINLYNNIL